MIRRVIAAAAVASVAGCAGTATYSVRPVYDAAAGRFICCEAIAFNGKDIAALQLDVATSPYGTVTVHFQESAVGATAPTAAQGAVVSNVATAIGNAAAAAAKFSLKP
ncbi:MULTISPECIES: hypothetical protein [unclassified Burkholderia]|uniref:hypothetical protein n=1 Tax=unclassified Burkholderia TaxID=2613784 RepID=UPI000F58AEA6|nr:MULTISPECIES: hypothetical protein [unclassified Burkholderia]RQS29387.1 hypothetical protein DIE05_13350 [Burkholderia sp. Bp8995]RQS47633.1 hypothetical protein DIE00_13930 [Burkholderia sp. Bp8989]